MAILLDTTGVRVLGAPVLDLKIPISIPGNGKAEIEYHPKAQH